MNLLGCILLLFITDHVLSQTDNQQKCAPPSNIASLPDYAQVELRDLWGSYTQGTPCDKELAIQQDVLNVVKTFSKEFTEKQTTVNNSGGRSIVPAATTPDEYDDDTSDFDANIRITTAFPKLIGSDAAQEQLRRKPKVQEYDEATIDDIATMQFNNAKAPFLRSVNPEVRRKFEKVWNNEDIPSESLRTLKIQTLAVSLLTAKQLEEYNKWATKRRYVLKAREQELRHLSSDAKRTLRRMSARGSDKEKIAVPNAVKRELRNFVAAFNRRRTKALQ
ncbi:hypothetical protein RB195_025530 [Necator americanus]|uniref:SXP/RAL-2 family protein Ani s 5-like cation-binding domain-containing protein n=1 Tax=Necator americanus TaxID=51031 RepID=A0ABR1EST3_NECAM